MARWMVNLDGGPKRVNHAAVAIGDKIYSFGGYSATEANPHNEFIDVHLLNTFSYRWERLPVFPLDAKARRSATISGPAPDGPSTSQPSSLIKRRRAHSLSDLHPLAQIRVANPPLLEEEDIGAEQFEAAIESPQPLRLAHHSENSSGHDSPEEEEELSDQSMDISILSEEDEQMDQAVRMGGGGGGQSARAQLREMFAGIEEQLAGSSDEDFDYEISSEEEEDEFMETEGEDESDDDSDEEDEPRMLVRLEGLGELQVPVGMDLAELKKFQENPEIPFKRYGHTVVAYKGQIYLWGGRNDSYGCRQTLHRFDPAHNRWSLVQAEGQCPPARDGHTAVVWADSMFIFGGYEEHELRFSQETYAFHFPSGQWSKVRTQGEPPQYRDFHTACVLDGKMFVFGGRSDETGQSHTSHDLYDDKFRFLDLRTQQWHLVEPKGRQRPCGRRSHTMWTFGGQLFLFGGFQSILNRHFNDLWRFDPGTGEWTEIVPTGQGPSPRRRQCTVMVGQRLFLFGGTMPNPRKRPSNNALEDLGDLFVLDFAPSLASLCLQAVLKHGLKKEADALLPLILRRELQYMSTPNQFSKPIYRMGTNMRG